MWLTLAGFAACGDNTLPRTQPLRTQPLWSDGKVLRDSDGRTALLRGINARVDGVFDVTFGDGRAPLEPIPALAADDCDRMHALGLDLLRLPINWSAVEPVQGQFDDTYLARVDGAVQCAARAGLFVVIDFHEDAYSKEIGEDGAPQWAIVPPPTMLLSGPLTDLAARRASAQVQAAFASFFKTGDPDHLQAALTAAIVHVAIRWANDPAVLGFELFNEPLANPDDLLAFHTLAATAVRAAAPQKLVFFEPSAVRNLFDFAPRAQAPFPVSSAVYAPHIYTYVFQPDQTAFESATIDDLEPSISAASAEAASWGTPLWLGEYGCGPNPSDPQTDTWMHAEARLHDRYGASDAFWLWKEDSQSAWGMFDHDAATDTWTERPQVVDWLSRVHAARIAGTPSVIESTDAGDAIHVEVQPGTATAAPHVIYVPDRFAAATLVRCDGSAVDAPRDPASGLVEVACGGALDVGP